MVAAFGSSDVPTSAGQDPVTLANNIAAWVKEWGLDGVDVDYEVCFGYASGSDTLELIANIQQDFNAMDAGTAEAWLITFTTQLRSQLPSGDYIITHARECLTIFSMNGS